MPVSTTLYFSQNKTLGKTFLVEQVIIEELTRQMSAGDWYQQVIIICDKFN